MAAARGTRFEVEQRYAEGDWVGAGEPLMYISGSLQHLVDLETVFLQKLGPPCVAAFNAFLMCTDLPYVGVHRHGRAPLRRRRDGRDDGLCGERRLDQGAARGQRARASSATPTTRPRTTSVRAAGLGTMPHALIGYAGSTLRAAEMFHETFPHDPLYVLVDYFGREVSDTLEVCRAFPDLAAEGRLGVRVDTHGGRFVEGLDTAASYAVLDRHCPDAVRTYRTETELRWLVGTGVTAAAIFHLRETARRRPASTRSRSSRAPASARRSAS